MTVKDVTALLLSLSLDKWVESMTQAELTLPTLCETLATAGRTGAAQGFGLRRSAVLSQSDWHFIDCAVGDADIVRNTRAQSFCASRRCGWIESRIQCLKGW